MRIRKKTPALQGIIMLACTLIVRFAVRPALAQTTDQNGANLLENGGFESPYYVDDRGDGGGEIAHGWSLWYFNDPGVEYDGPVYREATIEKDPTRIHDGVAAQQYYREYSRHLGGLYQTVEVPANSLVQLTIYGHAWSTFCETKHGQLDCDPLDSSQGGLNPISMKVGIDPTGGTDPYSSNIVWSAPTGAYDSYQLFSIEATAAGETVTVYTFSEPQYASPVINVYWDDATLRAVGGSTSSNTQAAAAPTASSGNATPTAAQTSGFGGIVPQPPRADGSQWHTVKAGETLGGIGRAYDVRTQTIRELNQLTSDVLRVGQELLIREFTETPTPEITPSAIPPTPTPQEVAEAQTGEICLTLFEDTNENGLREASEPILSNGRVNLRGAASASYVTEASGDPYCFVDLLPGDYEVTTDPPDGYHHTGIPSLPVTLSSGGAISLSFGAAADVPAQLASPEPEPMVLGLPRGLAIGLIAGAGALLVVLAGVATFFLMKSHSRGNTEPHHET